jgi:hypothetical protein
MKCTYCITSREAYLSYLVSSSDKCHLTHKKLSIASGDARQVECEAYSTLHVSNGALVRDQLHYFHSVDFIFVILMNCLILYDESLRNLSRVIVRKSETFTYL